MDTIETTEPVGVEGATSSQDTSADDTQPAESTDSVSDGEVAEAGEASETLLAGKYKSPEELEKAYTELQQKLGETSQKAEVANLLERTTGMNAQQIKAFLDNQQQQQLMAQYQDNPVPYLAKELQDLKSQIALQKEEQELDKFLSSPEGQPYTEFKDKILKLGLNLERDKDYADIAREYFGQARAKGQQDAYKKIDTKQKTQATSASQSSPKARFTEEDMDKMSVAELESILPWADTSNRL